MMSPGPIFSVAMARPPLNDETKNPALNKVDRGTTCAAGDFVTPCLSSKGHGITAGAGDLARRLIHRLTVAGQRRNRTELPLDSPDEGTPAVTYSAFSGVIIAGGRSSVNT